MVSFRRMDVALDGLVLDGGAQTVKGPGACLKHQAQVLVRQREIVGGRIVFVGVKEGKDAVHVHEFA